MSNRLYYVHDPMCSWCWGFSKTLNQLLDGLPEGLELVRLVGGLAADSDEPMPMETRDYLQRTWRAIQQRIPGTEFNFDFWSENTPRRSTYPACRAVISARRMDPGADPRMTRAIQEAYYLHARNPSDEDVLVECAQGVGLDEGTFRELLRSEAVDRALREEISLARALGCDGFPSLLLEVNGGRQRISVDYNDAGSMLGEIRRLL